VQISILLATLIAYNSKSINHNILVCVRNFSFN